MIKFAQFQKIIMVVANAAAGNEPWPAAKEKPAGLRRRALINTLAV